MRNWLAVGVVGVVSAMVGVFAAGCAGSTPVSVSQFCNQKAEAECGYVVSVCGATDSLTQSACVSARTSDCLTDASNATSSGQRTFNPNNISACLNAITSAYGSLKQGVNETALYSDISGTPTDTTTADYLCESVFEGNITSGATCTSTFDCADSNVCTPSNGGAKVDVCAPLVNVADGASCGAAGSVCVSGDTCGVNKNTGEYLCEVSSATLGELGDACTTDADCDPSMAGFCDIYSPKKHTCQTGYQFGLGYDCQAFGGSPPQ